MCVFVFHLKIQEAMLTDLFNYIYNDYRQLFDFSLRENRSTGENKDLVHGNRAGLNAYIIISGFSRVFQKTFDVTRQLVLLHHTDHTHECAKLNWLKEYQLLVFRMLCSKHFKNIKL